MSTEAIVPRLTLLLNPSLAISCRPSRVVVTLAAEVSSILHTHLATGLFLLPRCTDESAAPLDETISGCTHSYSIIITISNILSIQPLRAGELPIGVPTNGAITITLTIYNYKLELPYQLLLLVNILLFLSSQPRDPAVSVDRGCLVTCSPSYHHRIVRISRPVKSDPRFQGQH